MLNPGDRFGDYRVLRLLGKGGMGSVFLLENAEGVQIAAKILDPATASDREARKRFLREAQLALGVKHPNLVETYDVGEDPETGLCYILMEYVPGGDLAGRIEQKGALPISEATRVAYEIASVLELARQKGIVHRDIKPANIMFGADGKAKLADLGIARSGFGGAGMTTVTQTGMMIGTPAYMAPEQMLDAHNVDCRADIYSLGIVFYEMLTGERPNKDDTVVQLMAKALKGEPLPDVRTLRPEVSASLAQLLNMMVAPDKDGRISTPWQIMGALDIIARGGKFGVKTAVIADGRARTASAPQNGRSRKPFPWRVLIPIGLFAGLAAAFAILAPKRELVKSLVTTNVVERVVEKVAVRTSVVERVAGGIRETARRNESVSPSVDRRAEAPVKSVSGTEVSVENGEQRKRTKVTDRRVRFSKSGEFTWWYTIENGNALIWRGNRGYNNDTKSAFSPSTAVHVEIPSSLDGYKVSGLGCLAFFRCNNMVSVAMPEGLEEIRGWAFELCRSLREISLPSTVKVVHPGAFCSCGMLREIDFNMATNVEGSVVFCTAVDKFRVSPVNECLVEASGLIYSKDFRTLFLCPRTKESVVIPDSVRRLGMSAFDHCIRLESVVLPQNLRELGTSTFAECKNLRNVRIEGGLEKIGARCFRGCVNMSAITFPPTLKKIGSAAFSDCRNLRKIEFMGDAPEFDSSDGTVFGKGLQDCEIVVRRGTKGWTDPATGKLPERWPLPGFDDSLPIRYADEVDSHAPKTDEDRSKDDAPAEWNKGPSDMWFVDWDKAYAEAKRKRKKLFVLNTGPDWCGWCVKLRRNVLDLPEFEKYAKKNLVLLYLDNPRRTPMPKEQRAHNRTVCKTLGFSGSVPYAGVFTVNGKKLGVIGGGNLMADEYVDRIEKAVDSKGRKVNGDDAEMLFKGRCGKLMEEIAERRARLPKVAKDDFKAKVTGVALERASDSEKLKDPDPTQVTQRAFDELFPGWRVSAVQHPEEASGWAIGYQSSWRGGRDVVVTMPPNMETPTVISRRIEVGEGHPVLNLEVASQNVDVDFLLSVLVNGKTALEPRLICTPEDSPYARIQVPLSAYKGRKALIEIVHAANNWFYEHAFWRKIEIVDGTGKERAGIVGVRRIGVFPPANSADARWLRRTPWRYTEKDPGDSWKEPSFDDSRWRKSARAFGRDAGPKMSVAKRWQGERIWLRRSFSWNASEPVYNAVFNLSFDQDVEIFLNGTPVLKRGGWNTGWDLHAADRVAFARALRPGENVLAVTVNGDGPSFFDCGLVVETLDREAGLEGSGTPSKTRLN